MDPQAVASQHQKTQAAIAAAAAATAVNRWGRVNPQRVESSWTGLLPGLLIAVAAAQLAAAGRAEDYTSRVLAAQGVSVDPAGVVDPRAFAGIASDGRDLASLLAWPAIVALMLLRRGETPPRALAGGRASLGMIVRTQVADSGRTATGAAIAARRGVGYVRMAVGKSCSRCLLLAGREYAFNQGFDRHPRCDCVHLPKEEAKRRRDLVSDPKQAFNEMSRAEQDRVFTRAGAEAIRNGADIGQVVNARKGMSTTVGPSGRRRLTTERVFGRDVFITRTNVPEARPVRLMPEQILIESGGNRDEAVRLLKVHGYIT